MTHLATKRVTQFTLKLTVKERADIESCRAAAERELGVPISTSAYLRLLVRRDLATP